MKKLMMAVAGLAMAVALTGCGGSPTGVAEAFAKAIIQKEPGKALEFYDSVCQEGRNSYGRSFALRTKKQKDDLKKQLEDLGKKINDEKYDCKAILEQVFVPSEDSSHMLINNKKYTGETAKVVVQYVKGDDKKQDGLEVSLVKVDGSWKVTDYETVSGLDTDK